MGLAQRSENPPSNRKEDMIAQYNRTTAADRLHTARRRGIR